MDLGGFSGHKAESVFVLMQSAPSCEVRNRRSEVPSPLGSIADSGVSSVLPFASRTYFVSRHGEFRGFLCYGNVTPNRGP